MIRTLRMVALGIFALTAFGCAKPNEDEAAASAQNQTAGEEEEEDVQLVALDCILWVGEQNTKLVGTNGMLAASVGGFKATVLGSDAENGFSVFVVSIDKADGTPVARASGTPETLTLAGGEALTFMNHSREDEVTVKCTERSAK